MKIFISLFILSNILFSQSTNDKIHALEKASPQERVRLMNHIKKELMNMTEEKRMRTIHSLREKLQAKHTEIRHKTTVQEGLKEDFSHREGNHQNVLREHLHQEQQIIERENAEHEMRVNHVHNSER